MIRAVRPTDAVALFAFLARAHPVEYTAQTWPEVPLEHRRLSLVQLLLQPFVYPTVPRGSWASLEHGRVTGLAVARARAGGLVWDVERLLTAPTGEGVAQALLDHLATGASRACARRIFFDAPPGPPGMDIARRAGYVRYTSSALFVLNPPFAADCSSALAARPRVGADEHPLFQMYNAAVPLSVRTAEAMTCDEWAALYRGPNRWAKAVFGAQEQYVWELEGSPIGWMELDYGRRSQHVSLLVHPKHEDLIDSLLQCALSQASARLALYATVRDYQPRLMSALERFGFRLVGESDSYVRHLAARVSEARLMPAKIAG